MTNPILTVTKDTALFRSHLNRNILSRSHPKSYHANIKISVISRYHGNCYRENIKLLITYCYCLVVVVVVVVFTLKTVLTSIQYPSLSYS